MSAAEDRPAEGGGMGKDEVLAIIDADKDAAFYHRDDSIGFHAADRAEQKSIAARATVESLFAEVERLKADYARAGAGYDFLFAANEKLLAARDQAEAERDEWEAQAREYNKKFGAITYQNDTLTDEVARLRRRGALRARLDGEAGNVVAWFFETPGEKRFSWTDPRDNSPLHDWRPLYAHPPQPVGDYNLYTSPMTQPVAGDAEALLDIVQSWLPTDGEDDDVAARFAELLPTIKAALQPGDGKDAERWRWYRSPAPQAMRRHLADLMTSLAMDRFVDNAIAASKEPTP
jgi:hypothetical protein